ncbi:MAG: SIR2 family protein [Firmicutes bacterium]|nr:SIR2 family protein [Bacillota bacterium]
MSDYSTIMATDIYAPLQDLDVTNYLQSELSKSNQENFKVLVRYIKNGECAFILGAGVSYNINLPLWSGLLDTLLLQGIARDVFDNEHDKKIVQKYPLEYTEALKNASGAFSKINTLEAAEYVMIALEKNAYLEKLRQPKPSRPEISLNRRIAAAVKGALIYYRQTQKEPENFTLLINLASFFAKGVKQVITYNYDDGLEKAALGGSYNSFGMRDCVYQVNSKTNIYHVHGRLSIFNTVATAEADKDMDDGVILTERSYSKLESTVYDNTNTCQAQILASNHCLFMGFSCQDYNFRRIVRNINPSHEFQLPFYYIIEENRNHLQKTHIIFYPIDDLLNLFQNNTLSDVESTILNRLLKAQASYLVKYNIYPIFITHKDLNTVIEAILDALTQ